jgi:hypothetical protein
VQSLANDRVLQCLKFAIVAVSCCDVGYGRIFKDWSDNGVVQIKNHFGGYSVGRTLNCSKKVDTWLCFVNQVSDLGFPC